MTVFEALKRALPHGEIEPFQTPVFRAAQPQHRYESCAEMKFELEHPAKVKLFHQRGAPLLERNPLLFFKLGFFLMPALNVLLLLLWLARRR